MDAATPENEFSSADDHRHVRAADGHHEEHADDQRRRGEYRVQRQVGFAHHQVRRQQCGTAEDDAVHHLLARIRDRPARYQFLQLRERDQAAGERQAADEHAQHDGRLHVQRRVDLTAGETEILVTCHQRRRTAAEPVQQRHHLRHGRHLHRARHERAHRGADDHTHQDPGEADDLPVQQRGAHGHQHAGGAQHVAAPRRRRRTQPLQAQDEEDRGQQVRDLDEGRDEPGG
jgi:hypothetical protein